MDRLLLKSKKDNKANFIHEHGYMLFFHTNGDVYEIKVGHKKVMIKSI